MVKKVIDQRYEGDAKDREVSVVLLFEVREHGFVLDVDGSHFFASAYNFFELVGLNFPLIHG